MKPHRSSRLGTLAALQLGLLLIAAGLQAQQNPRTSARVALPALSSQALSAAVDTGPTPASQRLSLTLTLAADPARAAALDQFLADISDPSSPSYRHWLTPPQFAATYGAPAGQLAEAAAWAQSIGLSLDAISPSATRITVSGFVSQIQSVFAVTLHNYNLKGSVYFANATQPSLPAETAALFSALDGLDNLATSPQLSLPTLAAVVDANTTPILALDATRSTAPLSPSQLAACAVLFRQAAAQGITTIIARSASSSGFPAGLPDVTAVALPGDSADLTGPIAPRPTWQAAPGLPADALRHTPDLTVSSLAAFAQAIAAITRQIPATTRLGNIDATLYALAPTPGPFTQPDASATGTWQPATGLGQVDLAQLVKAFPHGAGASALSLTSSISNPVHGQSFTLTANINSANGGAVPTGTITFSSTNPNFTSFSAAVTNGVATSPAYLIAGGSYPIVASYSGDSAYAASTATANVTVQPEPAIFTIAAPASVALGGTITGTVTLSSASGFGTPNASVTVTPSGITSAAPIIQTLSGSTGTATAQYTFTSNKAGSVSLQASCTSNDSSFTCYTPQSSTTTVQQATPTLSLTVSPAAPVAGTPVNLSAPVTGVAGIPVTGSVQFFDGPNSIGTGSAPNATFSGLLLVGPNHVLTAVYQGDSNYLKATSNIVNTAVGTAPTTTTLNASAATAAYGQPISLNIKVSSTSTVNGTLPTGTIAFTGAGTITSAPVSGGAAQVTLNNLAVGTYTITTAYSGDSNYSPSTGNTVVLIVTQSTASLNPNLSTTSFVTGSTATLTVTITLPGSAQLPSGSTFVATELDSTGAAVLGGTYTGTFTVNNGGNTGTGAVIIPAPLAGSYSLQITCGVNPNFTCIPQTLSISSTAAPVAAPTTTILTISPAAPATAQPVTLTATVSAAVTATAANPIAGTVKFYDGTTLIGTGVAATVGTTAVATATVTLTGAAPHLLTAVYTGNTLYETSTSPALSIITIAPVAAIALTANVASGLSGTDIIFTATVTGSATTAPTGTVSFYAVAVTPRLLAVANLSATGPGVSTATFATTNLPSGSDAVYAVYSGDSNFATANSNTVTVGVSDYALVFTPTALAISNGQTASAAGVLTPVSGFTGTVLLSCTPPSNTSITCSLSTGAINGSGTLTLTVSTVAPVTHQFGSGGRAGLATASHIFGGLTFAALLCFFLPNHRRGVPALFLFLVAAALSPNLGCGTTSTASSLTTGTPLGTVNLTINTAGTLGGTTIRHNYTYQVTIQ